MSLDKINRRRIAAALWTVILVILTSVPASSLPSPNLLSDLPVAIDKLVHTVMFILFGALWVWALPKHLRGVLAAGVLLAGATEVWQATLPVLRRSGDPADVVANLIGLAIGTGAAFLLSIVRIPDAPRAQ